MLKLKLQCFGHLIRRVDPLEKTHAGRDWGQEKKGSTEDEMAGWHHWLDGHEFEWTPGVGDGQGGLACCNSWGRKESDTTERLNWTELIHKNIYFLSTVYESSCVFESLPIHFPRILCTLCWMTKLSHRVLIFEYSNRLVKNENSTASFLKLNSVHSGWNVKSLET